MKSNSDLVREKYEGQDHRLPQNLVELLLIRHEFLARNEMFIQEWTQLNTLYESEVKEQYRKARDLLKERWLISHSSGIHAIDSLPLFARLYNGTTTTDIDEGRLVIEIDLIGSQDKIIDETQSLITQWHREFHRRIKEGDLYLDQVENLLKKKTKNRLQRNRKKDLDEYYHLLAVWDARTSGLTFPEISKRFKIGSERTAGRHFKRAEAIIQEGIPGLPPFPSSV